VHLKAVYGVNLKAVYGVNLKAVYGVHLKQWKLFVSSSCPPELDSDNVWLHFQKHVFWSLRFCKKISFRYACICNPT
jgi:hypothetical protein